ncbi:MAG: diacylglycerol/polyprenol kinase family protein [Promethearchaeota archaeon]
MSTLPVSVLFIVNGVVHLFYGKKLNEKFEKEHNFYDTIVLLLLWIGAGIVYPFYFTVDKASIELYLCLGTLTICMLAPFIIFAILYYQKRKIKKNPAIRERRTIEEFIKSYDEENNNEEHSYKTDITRKALHLFPAALIIFIWVYSVNLWGNLWRQDLVWGISGEYYGKLLILTIGYSGILIFAALDYVRLSTHIFNRNLYHLIPDRVIKLLGKSIKRKEIYEFTKPVALVLTLAIIFFLPFPVFCAAALIATLGDAAASLFGKRFGRVRLSKKSQKTLEGCIAGFLTSFGLSVLSFLVFGDVMTHEKILIVSFIGAIVFLVIDITNPRIDDNILNPLLCSLVMLMLYLLI